MGKHPKTGQKRVTRMPMAIDALPMEVHRDIERLRGRYGLAWAEIERLSSLPYDANWEKFLGRHGFINWAEVPAKVAQKFPGHRLPLTNLHRWYDVRIEQKQRELLERSEQARALAAAFAKAGTKGLDEAVVNALRDVIFGMLGEKGDEKNKATTAKYLLALGEVLQEVRKNAIRERVAVADEKRVEVLVKESEQRRKKMERETESAARKLSKGEFGIEDINRLRERTFGLPPIQHAG
jgi:hypothetical protein